MLDLMGKSVALVGYGASNRALGDYLKKKGIPFVVRCPQECSLPAGQRAVFGDGYLDICEDIVFRSPGVRPDLIGCPAYTEVGYGLERCCAFKIGVSGSDGKTTTSTLIYRMLITGGKGAFLGGNIGYPIVGFGEGLSCEDYLVTELSSFQLMDMTPHLDIAVVTNISQNHLDWHRDMDEYILAKQNIVKNASLVVLNYDDLAVRGFAHACTSAKKCYFSLDDLGCLVGGEDSYAYVARGFVCFDGEALFPVSDICLRGDFNLKNVLCAVASVYPIVGKEACHAVAREFCGVLGRQEVVCQKKGVTYINSAIDTTPTRTKNTLSAFPTRRVVAILGGYDKNLDYSCLGEATRGLKAVILCGENSDKIGLEIKCRMLKANTLEEAVAFASNLATEGDFVILTPASASFDMFENYREKGKCFEMAVNTISW